MTTQSLWWRMIHTHPRLLLAGAAATWLLLYSNLTPVSEWIVALLPLERTSHFGGAVQFLFYETPKVLLLLIGVVFVMGIVNSYFTPERTRALLAGRLTITANILAASLGVVTPFCSCSAIPLFIGFLQAGVPLGVTFSFLIAAPMVNEVALALLFGLFGWQVALLYLSLGLTLAIIAGWIIGQLHMERYLVAWVRDLQQVTVNPVINQSTIPFAERLQSGGRAVRAIVGRVWQYILLGITLGALIHGYVPDDVMASFMGETVWWAVPVAVLIGIPMYTNAAGVIPVVQALLAKGAALGTTLAFMMSIIALSLPELLILRQVLQLPLIVTFVFIVATGIIAIGYIFNAVL